MLRGMVCPEAKRNLTSLMIAYFGLIEVFESRRDLVTNETENVGHKQYVIEQFAKGLGVASTGQIVLASTNGLAYTKLNNEATIPIALTILSVGSPLACGFTVGFLSSILFRRHSIIFSVLLALVLVGVSFSRHMRALSFTDIGQWTKPTPDVGAMLVMLCSVAIGAVIGHFVWCILYKVFIR